MGGKRAHTYTLGVCVKWSYVPILVQHLFESPIQIHLEDRDKNEWTPFCVGRKKVPISDLVFADDLLSLFGRVDEDTTYTVRDILETFSQLSGHKVNEMKSKLIFSPNTPPDHKDLFQDTLRVQENENLGTYLGLPISRQRPTRAQVQFVVDKVRTKLAMWKTHYLSKAGQLYLIKYASYYFSSNNPQGPRLNQ